MSRLSNDPQYLLNQALVQFDQMMTGPEEPDIHLSTHPVYDAKLADWTKWRLAYDAGQAFKDTYLEKFSAREKEDAFNRRKKLTYVTPQAQVAVNETKDSIFQRLVNVNRIGGTPTWEACVHGGLGGVDLFGSTMNAFIGNEILPDLLAIGKVGVYIDTANDLGQTVAERGKRHPYLYTYSAEDIRNWVWQSTGETQELKALLLRDVVHKMNPSTGLPRGTETQFRFMWKVDGGVAVQLFDQAGKPLGQPRVLILNKIPFVLLELVPTSLMSNAADYQIALMNLESSDLQYTLLGNIPLYTEQFNPLLETRFAREASGDDGSSPETSENNPGEQGDANLAKPNTVEMGIGVARRYPMGLDRPQFISPSAEPLMASMAKGDKIKEDIRLNVKLSLSNISTGRESAESKSLDERKLEAGLSAIGLLLEKTERQIYDSWANYEDSSVATTIIYPRRWDLKTRKERDEESAQLRQDIDLIPSITFKKLALMRIVENDLQDKVSTTTLDVLRQEIDRADIVVGSNDTIEKDIQIGLLSLETAASFRGYPEDEPEKAKNDHAERLRRIAESQASARGVPDLGGIADVSSEEKTGDSTDVE